MIEIDFSSNWYSYSEWGHIKRDWKITDTMQWRFYEVKLFCRKNLHSSFLPLIDNIIIKLILFVFYILIAAIQDVAQLIINLILSVYSSYFVLRHVFSKAIQFSIFPPQQNLEAYGNWAIIVNAQCVLAQDVSYLLGRNHINLNLLLVLDSSGKIQDVVNEETSQLKQKILTASSKHRKVDFLWVNYSDMLSTTQQQKASAFYSNLDRKLGEIAMDGGIATMIYCCMSHLSPSEEQPQERQYQNNERQKLSSQLYHDIISHRGQSKIQRQFMGCKSRQFSSENFTKLQYINQTFLVSMIQNILPHMMFRNLGSIILISTFDDKISLSEGLGGAIYDSTETFGRQLIQSMYYDYKDEGIDCLLLNLPSAYKTFASSKSRPATTNSLYLRENLVKILELGFLDLGQNSSISPHWTEYEVGETLLRKYIRGKMK